MCCLHVISRLLNVATPQTKEFRRHETDSFSFVTVKGVRVHVDVVQHELTVVNYFFKQARRVYGCVTSHKRQSI